MGAVFAIFAGFYFWAPKIIGKSYNELLGKIHFWTLFVGVLQMVETWIFVSLIKSKSINIEDLTNQNLLNSINTDKLDLEKELENMPVYKTPKPKKGKKGKKKIISEKLNNIPAELKFIDIKKSRVDILLNIKNKAGVYMFFNLINGNSYIGSSFNLERRFREHLSNCSKGKLPLYKSFRKYGINNFVFLVLQTSEPSVNVCIGLEQHFLDLYKWHF